MITDWIGRHDVLLPINQNYDKIRETNHRLIAERLNVVMNAEKTQQFTQTRKRAKWRVQSDYKHDAYTVQLMLKSGCW